MNARSRIGMVLPAALLLGGFLAAAASVDAAAPWFNRGSRRVDPQGDSAGASASGRDRDRGRGRGRRMYAEQRFISHLYQGFLHRQPTSGELRFWSDRLGRDADPTELVREIMDSDEFFVREIFGGVLGREPDASGMSSYMNALQNGQSRADVLDIILTSEEFRNRLR